MWVTNGDTWRANSELGEERNRTVSRRGGRWEQTIRIKIKKWGRKQAASALSTMYCRSLCMTEVLSKSSWKVPGRKWVNFHSFRSACASIWWWAGDSDMNANYYCCPPLQKMLAVWSVSVLCFFCGQISVIESCCLLSWSLTWTRADMEGNTRERTHAFHQRLILHAVCLSA